MKVVGFVLLISGAGIVLAALGLLRDTAQEWFVTVAVLMQIAGFAMVAWAHRRTGSGAV